MKQEKLAIIGAGASGMMAAITAARCGIDVTLLEAGERIGKKILSTGNGKCNLGNELLGSNFYNGGNPDFIQKCLGRFGTKDTKGFFQNIGLMIKDKNGYLYPFCEQASAVLDVLRYEINALGIHVMTGCKVKNIQKVEKKGFSISADQEVLYFDAVIITCGGKAAPQTGSDGSGYELAKILGHRIIKVVPALTALKCRESFFKAIAGVRADAIIKILPEQGEQIAERGELQLTDYGISGIPVFQLSRHAAYILQKQKELLVKIDFLPDLTQQELDTMIQKRYQELSGRTAEEFLTGTINKKLVLHFLKQEGIRQTQSIAEIPNQKIRKVFHNMKCMEVLVYDTTGFQNAQTSAGGISLDEIGDNMNSKKTEGLFFAGEILDVDGRCGGYNLQWAWTSGYIAVCGAAEFLKNR